MKSEKPWLFIYIGLYTNETSKKQLDFIMIVQNVYGIQKQVFLFWKGKKISIRILFVLGLTNVTMRL